MITLSHLTIALLVGAISFTTSSSGIFAPVREKIMQWSSWLGDLVKCPWCSGFWISLLITLTTDIKIIPIFHLWILDMFCTTMIILAMAGVLHWFLKKAYTSPASEQQNILDYLRKRKETQ